MDNEVIEKAERGIGRDRVKETSRETRVQLFAFLFCSYFVCCWSLLLFGDDAVAVGISWVTMQIY